MSTTSQKQITLDSHFDEVERTENFVDTLQDWADFDDDISQKVMLSLSEAVTNAIVHGNEEDPSKKVHVKADLDKNQLKISVKDEGEGFDPEQLSDPLKEENLMKEGGRGVFLIKQFTDKVEFSENGTKITLTFKI